MSLEQLSNDQLNYCYSKINEDIAERSMPGTVLSLVLWSLISYFIYDRNPDNDTTQWILNCSLVLIVTALLRVCLIVAAKKYRSQVKLSRALIFTGLFVFCFSWGLIAACAYLDTPLQGHSNIILYATAGLSAGGAVSFSASRLLTYLYLFSMLLPIIIVQLFIREVTNSEIVTITVLYIVGLLSVTVVPHRKYLSALICNLQLIEISNTDGLTGVRNRRYFDTKLYEEIQRAKRNRYPLSLLLIDIDFFKNINDQHGHQAGDDCLVRIAEILETSVHRVSDTIARYGGEEFAVIVSNTPSNSIQVAEKIRVTIQNSQIEINDQIIPVTVSIGVGTLENENEKIDESKLINSADEALYRAKELGRNRVEIGKH